MWDNDAVVTLTVQDRTLSTRSGFYERPALQSGDRSPADSAVNSQHCVGTHWGKEAKARLVDSKVRQNDCSSQCQGRDEDRTAFAASAKDKAETAIQIHVHADLQRWSTRRRSTKRGSFRKARYTEPPINDRGNGKRAN